MLGVRHDTVVTNAIESFFPTTVLMAEYPSHQAQNSLLRDSIYRLRETDTPGQDLSRTKYNVGYTSYFSDKRLLDYPGFQTLSQFILAQGERLANHQSVDLKSHIIELTRYWVNINPPLSFHHVHVHGDALFSGVYYVSALKSSGDIVFKDPRPAAAISVPPLYQRNARNTDSVTITPKPGQLLMFPGWLAHGVNQNESNCDRLSISYNLALRARHRSDHAVTNDETTPTGT